MTRNSLNVPARKTRTLARKASRHAAAKEKFTPPQGITYLESRSVRPATLQDYSRRLRQFQTWLGYDPLLVSNLVLLDNLLVTYLEELFDINKGIDYGVRAIAAVKFFHPLLGKGMASGLPRACRALKGWGIAAPPMQRLPIPLEGLGAILGFLIFNNKTEMALRLFIQFLTYLRPGECSHLVAKQQPLAAAGPAFRHWAILLHPTEDGIPGKTNIFDATVLIDSDTWIDAHLRALIKNKAPDDPLWTDSHEETNAWPSTTSTSWTSGGTCTTCDTAVQPTTSSPEGDPCWR